jgi:hypothetical protein
MLNFRFVYPQREFLPDTIWLCQSNSKTVKKNLELQGTFFGQTTCFTGLYKGKRSDWHQQHGGNVTGQPSSSSIVKVGESRSAALLELENTGVPQKLRTSNMIFCGMCNKYTCSDIESAKFIMTVDLAFYLTEFYLTCHLTLYLAFWQSM